MRTALLLLMLALSACAPRIAARKPEPVSQGVSVVRGGHATVWIDIAGFRVLTDPIFVGWLWMLPRHDALGLDPANLPPVDAIVISHTHMDHYDPWSIGQVKTRVPVLFPADTTTPVLDGNFYYRMVERKPTYELPWWRSVTIRNREGKVARITSVPAAHWGGRMGFDGAWGHTYGGWVIESGGHAVYFAGDTGYDPEIFKEIGKRFPNLDLALMPIGPVRDRSMTSRMLRHHINPPQALEAFELVGARTMIPMHYGAFFQSPVGPDVPLEWLRELLQHHPSKNRVSVIEPGEEWRLGPHAFASNERPAAGFAD